MPVSLTSLVSFKTALQGAALALLISEFKDLITTVVDFESQMQRVSAITQANDKELAALSVRARQLGKDTIFNATEAGKGLEELSRLGLSVNESIASISSVLDLAAASALGMGRAAEITAGTLKSFKLEVDDVNRVVDVLAITSARSGATVDSFGESVSQSGSTASLAGISLEEYAATIGVLGDRLIKGGRAGIGFRQLILGLSVESAKGAKGLAKLGLTFDDVNISTNGYIPVLQTLNEKFNEIESPIDKAGIAAAVWGKRSSESALVAIDSVEKLERLTGEYKDGAGAAKNMADVMNDSTTGAMKLLSSAFQEAGLIVGEEFNPSLRSAIELMTELTQSAIDNESGLRTLGKSIATIADSFGLIVAGFKGIIPSIGIVVGTIINKIIELQQAFLAIASAAAKAFTGDFSESGLGNRLDLEIKELEKAIQRNKKALEVASEDLGDAALEFEGKWDRIVKRWEEVPQQITAPGIDKAVQDVLSKIERATRDGTVSIEEEMEILKTVLRFEELSESIDLSKIDKKLKEELLKLTRTLIAFITKAGIDVSPALAQFKESLESMPRAVEDVGDQLGISGANNIARGTGAIVSAIETSSGLIRASVDEIKKISEDIFNEQDTEALFQRAAALEAKLSSINFKFGLTEEVNANLKAEIEGIVEQFRSLGERLPQHIADAASNFGILVNDIRQIDKAASESSESVVISLDKIGKTISTTASQVGSSSSSIVISTDKIGFSWSNISDEIDSSSNSIEISMDEVGITISNVSENADSSVSSFENLGSKIEEVARKADSQAESTDKQSESLKGLSDQSSATKESLDSVAKAEGEVADKGKALSDSQVAIKESASEVRESLLAQADALVRSSGGLADVGSKAFGAAQGMESLSGSADSSTTHLEALALATETIGNRLDDLTGRTITVNVDMSQVDLLVERLQEALSLGGEVEAVLG